MAMEINGNYSSYGAQGVREGGAAGNGKRKATEKTVIGGNLDLQV